MARSLDDDAARRKRDADERIYVVTTNLVIDAQEKLARRRRLDRIWRAGWAVSWLSLLTAVIGTGITALTVGDPARFVLGDLICGSLLLLSLLALVGVHFAGRDLPTLQRAEAQLASAQESLWQQKVERRPDLPDRRSLYREEVATAIEQYQVDSRKYRRIHNSLQSLIMIGSASTTTIAALDTGKELTWQSVTLTVISFAITVAAMFTGYYKFRERSYFLQQTADAIEQEANAVTLGIGPYSEFGDVGEVEALKLFTQRVEDHRNEQRRRQQQLDQPSDQAAPTGQPPAP
ncbi:DUF4231 domain-containing protein (plasmid) [Streptomyces sp. NBC_01210]|uniref:DUF4231 domain-containing protein n=1 Tax=Streptomyces sp. NBC_01210 TaxID=2903774 RepID=UPI002E124ACF|nr:DUF4231 domain-containing protein [Streptomyces sp. NBC_01210]